MAVKTGNACSNSCLDVQQGVTTTSPLQTLHLASLPACLHLVPLFPPPSTGMPLLRPLLPSAEFPLVYSPAHTAGGLPLPSLPKTQWFASVEVSLSFLSATCGKENFLGVFLYLRNDLTLPLTSIHYAACDTRPLVIKTTPRTAESEDGRTRAITPHCVANVPSLEGTLSQDFMPMTPLSWLRHFERRCHFCTSERKHLGLIVTFLPRSHAG